MRYYEGTRRESRREWNRRWKTNRVFTQRGLSLSDPDEMETLQKPLDGVSRIIFLDIDGVLNHQHTQWRFYDPESRQKWQGVDRELVEILNQVFDALPDTKVVLSSTWRTVYYDTIVYLKYQGLRGDVIGKTRLPDIHRGDEIQAWIDEHNFQGKWAALDDDTNCRPLGKRWAQTVDGVLNEHIPYILDLLK